MKKFLAVLLALAMLLSLVACGGNTASNETPTTGNNETPSADTPNTADVPESQWPEYLNMDSAYPVIKDEYAGTITLDMMFVTDTSIANFNDLFIARYFKDKYNIEFNVEVITYSALAERKTLMLNSGDMPDIIINGQFTASELSKYGANEGVLLQLDQYMSEELTPDILLYQEQLDSYCTAADGHVYTLPMLNDASWDGGSWPKWFVNKSVLDELGIAIPKTLDEFVDAMYAVKQAYPDSYPLGGGYADGAYNLTNYLLNAFGYLGGGNYGDTAAIRDGKAVVPAYDDTYAEFLKLMNQFYQDGILHPDLFTLTGTEVNALVNEGKSVTYANAPLLTGMNTWNEWDSLYPLTSDWQSEPEVPKPTSASIGNFVVSADTEYPELCLRFANIFFNNSTDVAGYVWGGVGANSEYAYPEFVCAHADEAGTTFKLWADELPAQYAETGSSFSYQMEVLYGNMWLLGVYDTYASTRVKAMDGGGIELAEKKVRDYENNSDHHYRYVIEQSGMIDCGVTAFPAYAYVEDELNVQLVDLESVIKPYIQEQFALFVTGGRSIDEFASFQAELV